MYCVFLIDKMMKSGLLTPVKAPPINFLLQDKNQNKKRKAYEKNPYPTSFFRQLYILLKRRFLISYRDPSLTLNRIGTHIGIAMFIGILYFGIGGEASNVLNNFNYLFFTVMFLMNTAYTSVSTTCKFDNYWLNRKGSIRHYVSVPCEFPILIKEHFNRWYSLKSYFLAVILADIPIQVF